MQFCIELPDDLGKELSKQPDIQLFIQNTIEKILLEKKQNSQAQLVVDIVNDLPEFPSFADKDPLEIQRAMRDEWD